MSFGEPFNLLKNHPYDGIPVAVTTGKMATWASERGRRHPGLDGLGELCYGGAQLLGPVEEFDSTDPRRSYPFYFTEDEYGQLVRYDPETEDKWCRKKYQLHRACDRILIVQNCYVEQLEGGGTLLHIPSNFQWYAPRTGRFKSDFVFPNNGHVRPWRGPTGDIEEWTTEPYASFLRYTWKFSQFETDSQFGRRGNILNEAARVLFEDGIYPDSWHITDENGELVEPVFRVEYPNTKKTFDGLPWSAFGSIDEAIGYILGEFIPPGEYEHPSAKVIMWAKIPEDANLFAFRQGVAGWGSYLGGTIGIPMDGSAFDLMIYTIQYEQRSKTWIGALDDLVNGHWSDWTSSALCRWNRCVARVVKRLPPIPDAQEGGVQV